MAFAEEIAPFGHFTHQLLEADGFPAAGIARPHPFERGEHAEGGVHLVHGRIATSAGRGAPVEPLVAKARQTHEAFLDRCLHGQMGVGRQRVVGVARHPQHLAGFLVDPNPHPADGGAAQTGGVADLLARIEPEGARGGIDGEFGLRSASGNVVTLGLLVQQAVGHAFERFGKTGSEGGQPTGSDQVAAFDLFHEKTPTLFQSMQAVVQACPGVARPTRSSGSTFVTTMKMNTHSPAVPTIPSRPSGPSGSW